MIKKKSEMVRKNKFFDLNFEIKFFKLLINVIVT